MARVPRVAGRSIKLNPLPDTTQKLNAPAAAFGGPDLTPALKHLERLFEQTSNLQKKGAPVDAKDAAPIDPQDAIIIDRLQADMAAAGDMFTQAQGAYREATGGDRGLYNLDAETLFSGGTRAEALLEWPTEDFDATGQGFASRLNDPRQRAIFEHLWDRDRAIELPRAEAYIRGREAEFRQGALARFWEGADRYRDDLTLIVEGNWRNYKAVANVYAEKLKDGLTIGASADDVGRGVQQLSYNDKFLIRALYDTRIKPGMGRAAGLKVARVIFKELLAAVKEKGEAALIHPDYKPMAKAEMDKILATLRRHLTPEQQSQIKELRPTPKK